jgi:hypothetical protein
MSLHKLHDVSSIGGGEGKNVCIHRYIVADSGIQVGRVSKSV